jgi:hypothetical protein
VFALDKETGNPVWTTQVDSTQLSFVTNSPIVYKDTAFVGVASNEELIAAFVPPANWQWQFRGSVVALDVNTAQITQDQQLTRHRRRPARDIACDAGVLGDLPFPDQCTGLFLDLVEETPPNPGSTRICRPPWDEP